MQTLWNVRGSESEPGGSPTKPRGRRLKLLVAGATVIPVAAVAGAWALFFTPDSPAELRLSTQPSSTASAVPTGLWSVGEGSVAGYRVREKLLRLPASNDAVGRTTAITGAFRLSGDRDVLRVEKGMRIEADLTKLKSDDDRRDDHMRTMAIETDLFPTATFVTTSDIVLPADLTAGGRASVTVAGDLTIHGVTRPVAVPVQAQHTGGRIEVVGSLSFPWAYFDMKQPNLSYVTVEADPTLELQLFFDRDASPSAPNQSV
jgi:polyisoprenoid-binding protein YceI